jgi:hypothetical protein
MHSIAVKFIFKTGSINIINPTGTLTIVGVPSQYGTTKPVWLMQGINNPISVANYSYACNLIYGSIKFVNIHYQAQQLDGTQNKLPQSLIIDKCLFEFSNIDFFGCSNDYGAIGGWPNGAKFRITNSYFRNLFNRGQWWGSRIFNCMHPIDTLWVENNTSTSGGLTFLRLNQLTDFAYFNHNTIVNNKKYWLLSAFFKELYINYK